MQQQRSLNFDWIFLKKGVCTHFYLEFKYKMKICIQFGCFLNTEAIFRRGTTISARTQTRWGRSQIENFWKKVVYSFLFKIEIQDENIYSFLGVFFNIEGLFLLSQHLWNGGGNFHPQKRRRERPAGISKLSRHAQLMTLCNMSEMPDGDEPRLMHHPQTSREKVWHFEISTKNLMAIVICTNLEIWPQGDVKNSNI